MIYSNDQEWDEWESSFEQQFWMTLDERKEQAQRTLPDINLKDDNEKVAAAEAMIDIFGSNGEEDINLEPMQFDTDIVMKTALQAAKDIVDEGNLFFIDNTENNISQRPETNLIQQQAEVHCLTNRGDDTENNIPPRSELNLIQQQPEVHCLTQRNCKIFSTKELFEDSLLTPTGIVIEDDIRGRKEEEQSYMLKQKVDNSIIKYTVKQKKGIIQTEINKQVSEETARRESSQTKNSLKKKKKKKLLNTRKRKCNNDSTLQKTTRKV